LEQKAREQIELISLAYTKARPGGRKAKEILDDLKFWRGQLCAALRKRRAEARNSASEEVKP
jgi:hypothetical protein